jgi:excisionase family DNA binding protein
VATVSQEGSPPPRTFEENGNPGGLPPHERRAALAAASPGDPLLMRVEDAATLLGLGRTRTYQLVMSGKIQSVKVGRKRLVVRAGLDRFIGDLLADQGPP